MIEVGFYLHYCTALHLKPHLQNTKSLIYIPLAKDKGRVLTTHFIKIIYNTFNALC